jgi:hypothetical protein
LNDHSSERVRAEAKYRKLQRASEGASAVAQYEAESQALREKTSRLRALRLAQETVVEESATDTSLRPAGRLDLPAQGEHIFRLGEILRFTAQVRTMAAEGDYEVVGLLPPRGEEPQYRIKNVREGHERVALQDQLSRP